VHSLAVCVIKRLLHKERVSGIENTREDIIDDRLCSVQRIQTFCHLVYLYNAFEKDKLVPGEGVVSGFKLDPRDKQDLRKRKVRLQQIKYWMATN